MEASMKIHNKNTLSKGSALLKYIKKNYQVYLMVAIPFALLCTFVLYPLLWNVRYSFYEYNGYMAKYTGLYNFKRIAGDMMWWKSVVNSFFFAGCKIAVMFPLSIGLAVILNSKLRGKNFFRVVYYLPNVTSMAVISMVFLMMFSGHKGIVNNVFLATGIIQYPVEWLGDKGTAMWVAIATAIWKDFGYEILLILAGLQGISQDLYESAEIDGANKLQQFWHITIPQLGPVLQIILMLSIVGSLNVFDLVNVLTGGGPMHSTDVMMTYLFNYYFGTENTSPQQGYAAAVSVVASVIIAAITVVYLRISKKMSSAN